VKPPMIFTNKTISKAIGLDVDVPAFEMGSMSQGLNEVGGEYRRNSHPTASVVRLSPQPDGAGEEHPVQASRVRKNTFRTPCGHDLGTAFEAGICD
jgi:hypothetical protein